MAAKLPMNVRKNIRDSEPARDEIMKEISATCGREMTFVPDFETNFNKFEGGRKEMIGNIYHSELLPAIAYMLKTNLADDMFKQAFDQTVTKNEIRFKIGTVKREETQGQSTYMDVYFEDGALVLCHTPEPCNVGDINYYNLTVVRGLHQSSKLPLTVRQNLKANEDKKNEALDKISKATGATWTFDESCIDAIWEEYEKNPDWHRYKDQVGSYFYNEALTNLAGNIETIVKDDMVKEGFEEMFSKHMIAFRFVKALPTYWVPLCEDGKLIVQFKDLCNFGNLSYQTNFDIVKLL